MCKPNTAIRRTFCSEIHGIFGSAVNFGVNIRSNCLHNFPSSSPPLRPESDWNSKWPNSINLFKNLTDDTRIWVWPLRISVGFWPEWRRGRWEIVETVGPDIHSEIHSRSKNTVNFGTECSANGCIWLAHSTSTLF